MVDFVRAQREHAEKLNEAWGSLLPEIENVDATKLTRSSFAQMAAALKDGVNNKSSVSSEEGDEAARTAQAGNAPMPLDPPPPEPSANAVCNTKVESSVLSGAVRYRDPLPEE